MNRYKSIYICVFDYNFVYYEFYHIRIRNSLISYFARFIVSIICCRFAQHKILSINWHVLLLQRWWFLTYLYKCFIFLTLSFRLIVSYHDKILMRVIGSYTILIRIYIPYGLNSYGFDLQQHEDKYFILGFFLHCIIISHMVIISFCDLFLVVLRDLLILIKGKIIFISLIYACWLDKFNY